MLLPFLVFVFVVAAIMGIYTAMMRAPGALAARRLDRRLLEISASTTTADAASSDETVIKQTRKGPLPALDRALERSGMGLRLARLIDQSGVRTTPSAVVIMGLIAGTAAAFLVSLFVHQPFAPALAGLVVAAAPFGFLMRRRSARQKRFEEQFPEALDLLARAIRAGHAFQTALGMVADELADPVGPEFKKTFDQQNYGIPLRDALNEMAARVAILDVRFFVTAVLIQRDTGGNLSEILDNLAHVVRERFKIKRQVRVHTAHGRFTGWVLLALPAGLAVALMFINPEHMNLLFRERMGQTMLIGAVVMQTVGFFWIRHVIKIEGVDVTLLIPLLAFLFASLLVTAAAMALAPADAATIERRLSEVLTGERVQQPADDPGYSRVVVDTLKKLGRVAPQSPAEMGKLQQKLTMAGYRSHEAIAVFFGIRLGCALLAFALLASPVLVRPNLLMAIAGSALGYLLPTMVLGRLAKRRQHRIRLGLADALDLLVVSVEAGLGLDQAIQRVGEEIAFAHPDLSDELRLINLELRAGKARSDALKNLGDRTGVDDIISLVAMLVQTDKFGTSVAQSLRVHSETVRTKRRQRAEEAAAKTGVKMVFPLVFCIFPSIWVVTIGPAAIKFVQVIVPMAHK